MHNFWNNNILEIILLSRGIHVVSGDVLACLTLTQKLLPSNVQVTAKMALYYNCTWRELFCTFPIQHTGYHLCKNWQYQRCTHLPNTFSLTFTGKRNDMKTIKTTTECKNMNQQATCKMERVFKTETNQKFENSEHKYMADFAHTCQLCGSGPGRCGPGWGARGRGAGVQGTQFGIFGDGGLVFCL